MVLRSMKGIDSGKKCAGCNNDEGRKVGIMTRRRIKSGARNEKKRKMNQGDGGNGGEGNEGVSVVMAKRKSRSGGQEKEREGVVPTKKVDGSDGTAMKVWEWWNGNA